jgi:glycosyltransferase involved in cell wall biosynthesis
MEARKLVEPLQGPEGPHTHDPERRSLRIAFIGQPRDAIDANGPQRGSIASITWELARRLAQRHAVAVYAPLMPGQEVEESGPSNVIVRRVPRVRRGLHKAIDVATSLLGAHPPYFATSAFYRGYAASVGQRLAQDPPDIVHIQVCSQFIPMVRRAVPRAHIVFHTHDDLLTRVDPELISRRMTMTDAVLTCSDYVTHRWRERFSRRAARVHTLWNGVDLGRFRPAYVSEELKPSCEILYVGRLSPEKGVHILAKAFETVLPEVPEARLSVISSAGLLPSNQIALLDDDPYIAELSEFYGRGIFSRVRKQLLSPTQRYIDAIRASVRPETNERIEFHEPLEDVDLPQIYRRASLLVAPSLCAESFGLPLAEAMASGLPVIASRSGGMPSIVEHGRTGCLVERGDVDGLARMMSLLLRNPEQLAAMRRAARLSAEARFGWDRAAQRLEEIYENVSSAA